MYKDIPLLSLILLLPSLAWASCSSNGDITTGTSPIILNTAGCATDGSMIAQLLANNTLTINGNGITAPITGSTIPWQITLQALSTLSTDSNGVVGEDGPNALPVTLNNYGRIDVKNSGALLTGGGFVTNFGTIIGDFNGVDISSTNGGTVFSPFTDSQVTNYGNIVGGTTGIHLGLGGTVNNNSGIITGLFGIETDNAQGAIPSGPITVNNYATIGAPTVINTGVLIAAGGTVNNFAGGEILAGTYGISVESGATTVYNNGTILATLGRGVRFANIEGGVVNNDVNGVISGLGTRSVSFISGPGVVNNAGTISGGTFATIHMQKGNSAVNNSGTIVGDVRFDESNDTFLMTAGQMSGRLLMGVGGNETATFQNVSDINIGNISLFNGGGGGNDRLIFNNSTHTGGSDLINWETISLNNGSTLNLNSTLTLGGLSADPTATLTINQSTLNANSILNSTIQANGHAALVNNAGIINLSSASANNSLTILGNYVGNGGLLSLNAVLNSDGSPADKLVINGANGGGSASGSTFISVHNTTGGGAKTNANGILLVEAVNNASTTANAFALSEPVRAGAYEYRLFRGGIDPNDPAFAEDWFLRSTFGNGSSILGPELSVFSFIVPTAMNIGLVTVGTLHERVGDESLLLSQDVNPSERFANGGWLRLFAQSQDETILSLALPSSSGSIQGIQAGFDLYRDKTPTDALNLFGVHFSYAASNPTINGLVTNAANTAYVKTRTGKVRLNARTGGLYFTHFLPSGAYLDLVAQGTAFNGDASSSRSSLGLRGAGTVESAEVGYPLDFLPDWRLEPETQLLYDYVSFKSGHDTFSTIDLAPTHALIGRIGARLQHSMSITNHPIEPYLRANFWSILSGDSASPVTYGGTDSINSSAKASWGQLGGGFTLGLSHGLVLYAFLDDLVNLGNQVKLSGLDGGIGLRANWA